MKLRWRIVCLECWLISSGLKKCLSRLLVTFIHKYVFLVCTQVYIHIHMHSILCGRQSPKKQHHFLNQKMIVCVCVCVCVFVCVLARVGSAPKLSPKQGLTIRCTWRWLSRVMSPSAGCSSAWNIINSCTPKPALQPASKRYADSENFQRLYPSVCVCVCVCVCKNVGMIMKRQIHTHTGVTMKTIAQFRLFHSSFPWNDNF